MVASIVQALRGTGGNEPSLMSRVLGVLLVCGGLLVLLALLASTPSAGNDAGLLAVGAIALAGGAACVAWAARAQLWMIHIVLAAGTGLICLGIYFADVATGAYSFFFVWLVVIAATFFSTRAVVAHLVWIIAASGAAIASVEASPGVSAFARWAVGSLLLAVAAAVMSQIIAGRRIAEQRLRFEIDENTQLQIELEHLAHHDPLTGLPNRRLLLQELPRELARADRQGTQLCVAELDLDGLKAYNDAHGHAAGDRLLKQAASGWASALRETDLIARMGGDEFVVLLPDCPPAEADRVVERLRGAYPAGREFSSGIACWDRSESADELLSRADAAMYRSKAEGRSSVGARRQP